VVIRFRPAWRQILALLNVAVVGAGGVYLVVQVWLGALPHEPLATWPALAAMIFAISSTTAGLVALIGPPGLGLAAVSMVFLGNPFSGVTSAPELLPTWAGHLGQWLPPGAAANLLRSTAYFDGAGAGPHIAVLTAWGLLGTAAIALGHRAPIRFAANSRTAAEPSAGVSPGARVSAAKPPQFVVEVPAPVTGGAPELITCGIELTAGRRIELAGADGLAGGGVELSGIGRGRCQGQRRASCSSIALVVAGDTGATRAAATTSMVASVMTVTSARSPTRAARLSSVVA
jgi:hypothetical protein